MSSRRPVRQVLVDDDAWRRFAAAAGILGYTRGALVRMAIAHICGEPGDLPRIVPGSPDAQTVAHVTTGQEAGG